MDHFFVDHISLRFMRMSCAFLMPYPTPAARITEMPPSKGTSVPPPLSGPSGPVSQHPGPPSVGGKSSPGCAFKEINVNNSAAVRSDLAFCGFMIGYLVFQKNWILGYTDRSINPCIPPQLPSLEREGILVVSTPQIFCCGLFDALWCTGLLNDDLLR